MEKLTLVFPHVYLFSGTENPLSSTLYVICDTKISYIVDCGNNPIQWNALVEQMSLLALPEPAGIIITHFHQDHFGLVKTNPIFFQKTKVFLSPYSLKYANLSNYFLVNKEVLLPMEFGEISLFPIVNNHAKGSLALLIKKQKILLLGDALCPKIASSGLYLNRAQSREEKSMLAKLDFDYVLEGHTNIIQNQSIRTKNDVLLILKEWESLLALSNDAFVEIKM